MTSSNRRAKPSKADKRAAEKLRAAWQVAQEKSSLEAGDGRLTQAAAGFYLGINQSAVSQYLKGDIPLGYSALLRFSKLLGVEASSIRDDLPEQQMSGVQESSGQYLWAEVKGFSQAVGMGSGPESEEYAESHKLKFRAESLARKRLRAEDLVVMYASGDSMLPRIQPGDAVLFDSTDVRPQDGKIFVLSLPGAGSNEYTAKRCEIIDELVFFKADNPAGDHNWRKTRRMDNKRQPITIVGRVRWFGSWED